MDQKQRSSNNRLNWGRIIQSDGDTTNRGIKFENLIEQLLIAMYGEKKWRRTQSSHDGKKDFAAPYEDFGIDTHWAECKNYNKRISINTLSPTLVMSAIEEVPNIIFFSFSQLNRNAYNYIGKFAAQYDKTITIYDDILLENLIYKYRKSKKNIDDFFPGINETEFRSGINIDSYKFYKFMRSIDGKVILSDKHKFEIGEKFKYVIVIHNISSNPITIAADTTRIDSEIRINPISIYKMLDFGDICEICFECEIVKYKKSIAIPDIEITIDGKKTVISKISKLHVIPVTHNFMCGTSHYEVFNSMLDLLRKGLSSPIILEGPSGIGKTTIINNIKEDSVISSKYHTIYFDGDENTSNIYDIIKNLLFQLIGMKYISNAEYIDAGEEKYLLDDYFYSEELDAFRIVNAIIKLSSFYNILFLIDNTNNLHTDLIKMLNVLFYQISNNNLWSNISFLLTVNTSVSTVDDILGLLNIDYEYSDFELNSFTLSEFSTNDTIHYFREKYKLYDADLYFDDNKQTYPPLFLDYFFNYVTEENIVHFNGDLCTVTNPIDFNNSLKKLNKSDTEILKTQEVLLYNKHKTFKPAIERVLKLLLLVEQLNTKNFPWLNKKTVQILCQYNIIKNEDGILFFRHNKIYQYYKHALTYSSDDYTDIFHDLENAYEHGAIAEKIICLYRSNNIDKTKEEQLFLTFFNTNPKELSASRLYAVCTTMAEWLQNTDDSQYIYDTILYIKNNLKSLTNFTGRENIYEFYETLITILMSDKALTWNSSQNDIAYIFKKYLDLTLSSHKNSECKKYFIKFCDKIDAFSQLTENDKNKWKAHYYNRMAIAADRDTLPLTNALQTNKYYETSENYAKNTSDIRLKEQIAIDNFNRHYYYIQDVKEQDILALSSFYVKNMSKSLPSTDLKAKFHIYLTDFLLNKNDHVADIDDILKKATPRYSSFYISKLRFLKLYSCIKTKQILDIDKQIDELFRYLYSHQLRHSIYKATYIKAQQSRKNVGDTDDTLKLFEKAYSQLAETMNNDAEKYRNIFLYRELLSYIFMRKKSLAKKLVKNCPIAKEMLNVIINKKPLCDNTQRFYLDSDFKFNDINYPKI